MELCLFIQEMEFPLFISIAFPIVLLLYVWKLGFTIIKKGVWQLALQFNFWVVEDIYNSLYLYVVSVNRQVTWIVKMQFKEYMVQLITIQLQFNQNNSFSTTMQFCYNCTHDVMLTSLIVIHQIFWRWHFCQNSNRNLNKIVWIFYFF